VTLKISSHHASRRLEYHVYALYELNGAKVDVFPNFVRKTPT